MSTFRMLIWHPESESLFEINDPTEIDGAFADGCAHDVTGIWEYENRFTDEKLKDYGKKKEVYNANYTLTEEDFDKLFKN